MADTFIDYDSKVQEALRSVVRSVLIDTERDGLVGDHHFYIAFKTQADGVMIPDHLVAKFPDEMTIVLQHKYWGLKIFDDYFEIGLSFNQTPEHLTIPFAAVTGFVDPSVQFALQFHDENTAPANTAEGNNQSIFPSDAIGGTPEDSVISEAEPLQSSVTNKVDVADDSSKETNKSEASTADKDGDNVVTLDAFRKK
jgi:hypothetical protein